MMRGPGGTEIIVHEPATRHPNQFLADLTDAMRSTAEAAQQAALDDCASNAASRVEQLRAQTDDGANALKEAEVADIATIRGQSRAQMEAIRAETERRIANRRNTLEQQLSGLDAAVERDVASVEEKVAVYEGELSRFFDRLLEGADPTVFAAIASQIPDPPIFEGNLEATAAELQPDGNGAPASLDEPQAQVNEQQPEKLPDRWWLDSPASLAARVR